MAFGTASQKAQIKSAPIKGSFPIDHEGDCKQIVSEYLRCIHQNKGDGSSCRQIIKYYLKCRMENGLMTKEPLALLGFPEENDA